MGEILSWNRPQPAPELQRCGTVDARESALEGVKEPKDALGWEKRIDDLAFRSKAMYDRCSRKAKLSKVLMSKGT